MTQITYIEANEFIPTELWLKYTEAEFRERVKKLYAEGDDGGYEAEDIDFEVSYINRTGMSTIAGVRFIIKTQK
jgi:hypothetical protein